MGKNNKKKLPFVSVCTPTFNRRPFIPIMFECFKNQTYPKDRIEWIIIDDGTDKIEDLIKESNIPQIQYFKIDKKMTLGAKRNLMHSKTKGSIIVYMDDDDYYPPERIEHAVEKLQGNPAALCAGSSEIYVYFKHILKMYKGGPYGPNHATAGTFAFKKELLEQTKYNEEACLAEEREFLKQYTIPFVQLDPLKTILVFSHVQNTFDKKKLLETPNRLFVPCEVSVDKFIKHDFESNIKKYFMIDIDKKLESYKPGDPIMKPDVLKQTEELTESRKKLQKEIDERNKNGGQIIIQRPGEEAKALTNSEIVQLLDVQKKEIEARGKIITDLQNNPVHQEIERRGKQIQILENVLKRLKDELETSRMEIADLNYQLNNNKKEENINMTLLPEGHIKSLNFQASMSKLKPEYIVEIPCES